MKRIKVGEKDYHAVADINNRIQTSKKILDGSIPVIKALIGRFDTEVLADIITGGNNTRNELETAILNDIEKLSSVIMKDEFRNKLINALISYDETAKAIVASVNNISDIIPVQNWCVVDDTARINDYEKIVEEITSIYIAGDKGIELYKRLEDIVQELNNVTAISKIYNVVAVGNPPMQRGFVNIDANGVYSINGVLTANVVKEVYK